MLNKIAPEIETPDPVKTSAPVILGEVLSAGDAARILKEPTHHICTNVPFLARGKQPAFLRAFCAEFYPDARNARRNAGRSEEHTSELQSRGHLVCRLLLRK